MRVRNLHGCPITTHTDELQHLPLRGRPTLLADLLAIGAILIIAVLLLGLIAYISYLGASMPGVAMVFVGMLALWLLAKGGMR
jgi:hypothetical protein